MQASKTGCGGGDCHGTRSTATVIHISTTTNQLVAGQTYVFKLSVANPSEKAGGCDISVDKGGSLALNGSSSGLQLFNGELTHTSPRTFTADTAVWSFKYTAPKTVGVTHIYAACNAVNLNGDADGNDHWNTIVDTLTVISSGVEPASEVPVSVNVAPNPSRGRITLSTPTLSGPAEIEVADLTGRIVYKSSVILEAGTPVDLSALSNGAYMLTLRMRDGHLFTRRIAIEK